jgi:tryptophan synthase alpha chain
VSRLEDALRGGGKLVAFTVAGDPTFEESYWMASAMIDAGADVIELGLPFSDPIADGPTIQEAGLRALSAGMNTDRFFELARRIREGHDTPMVCLTYYNIVLQYGLARFAAKASSAGIDGLVVPDLPYEEAGPLMAELRARGVDLIFLVAETTPKRRMERILAEAAGFVYVVALLGTTGAREALSPGLGKLIRRVKACSRVPVAVGFGISTPAQVRKVLAMGADAAIVGSGIVRLVPAGRGRVVGTVKALKAATRKGR